MGFDKLKFKEIIKPNGEVEYFINGQHVNEDTYNKLLNDDSLYNLPPLPKVNENYNEYIDEHYDEDINENYEELLNIVQDIKQMNEKEAINGLKNYLEIIKTEVYLQTLITTYNEIGNNSIKFAARLENELEDLLNEINKLNEE